MKTKLTANSKGVFYIANVAGLIIVLVLIGWFINMSIGEDGINLGSVFFWLAVLLLILVPFALISMLSAMKSVVVTEKGIIISYTFKRHKTVVDFSDVIELKLGGQSNKTRAGAGNRSLGESFQISLSDGRRFEFMRSQFDNYDKLKTIIEKALR